ncbi:MAG: 16S rRNA (guanine(527)-N(7))-methyltransferase RsmG [Ureaplasma sp.]|nr:16S rRNA (guanine(527)-N(7))-methyltransferase RsmG [Ureaplasma sp.]
MTKLEFQNKLKEMCPWVDSNTFTLFESYKSLLQEYNKKFNLTRLDSDDLIYDQYFLASLMPFIYLEEFNKDSDFSLLDIGTGSGIPGVVLKIIYPNLKIILLDSNKKKCLFLEILIKKLNLNFINVICERAEDFAYKNVEKFDYVTSRAVAKLSIILELSVLNTKINGKIITSKSLNYYEELAEAAEYINLFNLSIYKEKVYDFSGHKYIATSFIKNKTTPPNFPRIWSKIKK